MIRFERITKAYADGPPAVDDLTLEAPTGAITVLVGPSGCGKTTTLRMVNRMIEPTSGRILIDGVDTASMNPAELRRGIGYVIQHGGLFPHQTVERNIATVPLLLGWDRKLAYARARELLETVGLDAALGARYPAALSGGQQQRVGVARALAADPPVMLMDEPFSAVDPVVRDQLQEEFRRLQEHLGKTILFVTHDIDEAIKLGDQVAVLRVGGVLAQVAAPADLLAHPADDFVAGFVGRDRGYRALGFVSAQLRVRPERTVSVGEEIGGSDGWVLAVEDGRPLGWVDGSVHAGPVAASALALGGTLAPSGGTLRAALDAALSSPSGRGVVIDEDGRVMGTVTAGGVLAAIEASRGDVDAGVAARAAGGIVGDAGVAAPTAGGIVRDADRGGP